MARMCPDVAEQGRTGPNRAERLPAASGGFRRLPAASGGHPGGPEAPEAPEAHQPLKIGVAAVFVLQNGRVNAYLRLKQQVAISGHTPKWAETPRKHSKNATFQRARPAQGRPGGATQPPQIMPKRGTCA